MFGPGIPILFPLALLYVLTNESMMRLQIAFLCKKPFNYDKKLIKTFMKHCAILPVLYASYAIWMFSNRQIFDNVVQPLSKLDSVQDHSHTIVYTMTTITPALPLQILLVISILNFLYFILPLKIRLPFDFLSGENI